MGALFCRESICWQFWTKCYGSVTETSQNVTNGGKTTVRSLSGTIYVYYFFSLLCIFLPKWALSQAKYSIQHYTSDNGLPQNSIKSISADATGFVWLASEDGLVRFDGRNFAVFGSVTGQVNSMRVMHIAPTFSKHHRATKNNERVDVAYAKFISDEWLRIEDGKVFADTAFSNRPGGRAFSAQMAGKKKFDVVGLPALWTTPLKGAVVKIEAGRIDGNFFLCDSSQATYYSNWKPRHQVRFSADKLLNYFSVGGELYYFDGRGSLVHLTKAGPRSSALGGDIASNPVFGQDSPGIKLYWNLNSDQAYLYLNKQLYSLEQGLGKTLTTKLLVSDFDFPGNHIVVIHHDRQNKKVFLGSPTNGLFVLTMHQFETVTLPGAGANNVFYAQLPYDSNSVVTPTGIVIGKKSGKPIHSSLPALMNVEGADDRTIFRDKRGDLWISRGWNLFRVNPKSGTTQQWLFKDQVEAIYQTGETQLCVGIIGKGIYKIDLDPPQAEPQLIIGDYSKRITCFGSRHENDLLVGTMDGLYALNVVTGNTRLLPGTENAYITSITPSRGKHIWLTAQEKGVMLIDGQQKAVLLPIDKNGYLNSAHCVVPDSLGYLWVPTNKGLFQMRYADVMDYAHRVDNGSIQSSDIQKNHDAGLFYLYHTADEGFKTNEFNGNCFPWNAQLSNGYVSLPSLNGLVWFRPSGIGHNLPENGIVLDRITVNRHPVQINGDTLQLPLSPENIRLYFSTAYFGNPYNLNLWYALLEENADVRNAAWQSVENKDGDILIQYSSLKSGKYQLLIRKQSGFGIGNYITKTIHVIVPELWYETLVARLLLVCGLVVMIITGLQLYNRYKIRVVRKEKQQLEQIVIQRTDSLRQALSELEESKSLQDQQLQTMSRMLASISHDVLSPLNYITTVSGELPGLASENDLDEIAEVGSMIETVSGKTTKLVRDLLSYLKIQVYGKKLHFEEVRLNELINEKIGLFESIMHRKGIGVIQMVPGHFTVRSDYQLLSIIIHNLVDNAIKYTSHGQIEFHVREHAGQSQLVVSNSGMHLPQETIDFVNSTETETNEPFQAGDGGHLGLIIVKEVARLIGVEIKADQSEKINFYISFFQLDGRASGR
jgi:signal transduction histidine kinase